MNLLIWPASKTLVEGSLKHHYFVSAKEHKDYFCFPHRAFAWLSFPCCNLLSWLEVVKGLWREWKATKMGQEATLLNNMLLVTLKTVPHNYTCYISASNFLCVWSPATTIIAAYIPGCFVSHGRAKKPWRQHVVLRRNASRYSAFDLWVQLNLHSGLCQNRPKR